MHRIDAMKYNDLLLLKEFEENNIMNSSEILASIHMLKEKKVGEVHKEKIYLRKDDGRYVTKIFDNNVSKQISGKDKNELMEKLYEFYFGKSNSSMEVLFPDWINWRKEEISVTDKTIRENGYLWNSLLRDTDIVKVPLKNLLPKDYIKFFRKITKDGNITRKKFNDMKSIMNGIIYYAIEEEIISHNHLKDINYRQFTFKPENTNIIPYNEIERRKIINYFGDDLISLAIKLDFYLPLRIGELKGLKFSDIEDGYLYIQRFINDKGEVVNHVKGNKAEGKRYIPLTDSAKKIIDKAKEINPNSDFIFFNNGKPLVTSTFNRRIKSCCKNLGIEYRSSHKIRFSTASILNRNGIDATELQRMLGHTTLTMTNHYLRNVTPKEETSEKMKRILG